VCQRAPTTRARADSGERGARGRRRLQGAQSPAHGWQRHQHHNRDGEPRERRRRAGGNGLQQRFVHVGEIAGLDDRIHAHPVGQQRLTGRKRAPP